jgi:hypothetical protein
MQLIAGSTGRMHKDHRFAASRDEAIVRSAVHCDVAIEAHSLVVTLRPGEVGHAFPTGDMFRRIVLAIEVVDTRGSTVSRTEKFFERAFGFVQSPYVAPRKVLVRDDRVGVSEDPVVFRYEPPIRPDGGTLRYQIRYERVADPFLREDGTTDVEGAITLSEGTFPIAVVATE